MVLAEQTGILPRGRATRRLLIAALLVSAVFRAVLLAEFVHDDLGLEGHPTRDMRHYYRGAKRVLEGDLTLSGSIEDFQLSVDMMGEGAFERLNQSELPLTQAPLYTYCLALSLRVSDGTYLARTAQVMAWLAVAWLTYLLAVRTTGNERLGAAAAVLVGFNSTSTFFAAFLLRATLLALLTLVFVLALQRYATRPGDARAGQVGIVLGMLHLAKTTLVFGAPAVALAIVLGGAAWKLKLRHGAVAVAAFLLVVSPLMVRNAVCEAPLLQNEGFGHFGIVAFNHPGADGVHLRWPPREYVHRVMERSGPSALSVLRESLAEFPNAASFIALMLRKFHGFWNGYEARNNLNYHAYTRVLSSLRLFPVSSLVLLPLALAGVLVFRGTLRRRWPLYVGLLMVLLPCLAAAPLARYRVVAIPFLAIFAASLSFDVLGARSGRRAKLIVLLALAAAVAYPLTSTSVEPYRAYRTIGMDYTELGDYSRASRFAQESVRLHPLSVEPPVLVLLTDPRAKDYLAVNRWAYDMAQRAGDDEGARRIRASLQRRIRGQR